MFLVKVYITLKESVLDPQGQTVRHSLAQMGEDNVTDVRIGKYIEFTLGLTKEDAARETATRVIEKLLVNPVTETYRFDLEKKE